MNKENTFTHYPSSYFAEPLRITKCLVIYSLLNATVAQSTNCHLEVTMSLRSKTEQLHPTISAHFLVATHSAR